MMINWCWEGLGNTSVTAPGVFSKGFKSVKFFPGVQEFFLEGF